MTYRAEKDLKAEVLILGSCVTRDIFRLHGNGIKIVDYYARTSYPSLVSKPFQVNPDDVALDSQFQKRNVIRDFEKSFWTEIRGKKFDLLMLDLIDERFNLLKNEETIITKSVELVNSGFLERHKDEFIEISRNRYKIEDWADSCQRFVERIKEVLDPERIVITKTKWALKLIDDSGCIVDYEQPSLRSYNQYNEIINKYYNILIENLPEATILESPHMISNKKHVWGLSPVHYIDDWYSDCRKQLDQKICELGKHE
jgi:hypothetical protein